MHLHVTLKSLI